MSDRCAHVQGALRWVVVAILVTVVVAQPRPSLPLLAGATTDFHFAIGIITALLLGWIGGRLPDWIEPPRTPNHRGLFHSVGMGMGWILLSGMLINGTILGGSSLEHFLLRLAILSLGVGYLNHLFLDLKSQRGLPLLFPSSASASSVLRREVFLLGLGLFSVGAAAAFWDVVIEQIPSEIWEPVVWGFASGTVVDVLLMRNGMTFTTTFLHELNHATAAVVFGRQLREFKATRRRGGYVAYYGRSDSQIADTLITLAPYLWWPSLTVFFVVLRPLIAVEYLFAFDVALGLTLGLNVAVGLRGLRTQFGDPRADIGKVGGLGRAFIHIIPAALTVYGIMGAILVHGYSGLLQWVNSVFGPTMDILSMI